MSKNIFWLLSVVLIPTLIISGCQIFGNPSVSSQKIDKVISSGKFVEDTELQRFPIFNCQSQVQNSLKVERTRTLARSVHLNINTKSNLSDTLIGEIVQEIGIAFGWTSGTNITDSGGLILNADPKSYPVYTIAWKQYWEQGQVEITTKDGKEQIPYEFLSAAHPEIRDIRYIECSSSGFATATEMAKFFDSQATNLPHSEIPPTNVQPTSVPTSTAISLSQFYDDFNNPAYDGSFDKTKWSLYEEPTGSCNIIQQDGHLTLTHTSSSSFISGCFLNGSFSNIKGSRFQSFEAKMLASNNYQGDCCGILHLVFGSGSFSGGGGWIECGLDIENRRVVGNFDVKHGQGVSEFSRQKETTFDSWHTLRLNVDQSSFTVSCYIDDNLIGSVVPKDASVLKEANFSRYIQIGWAKNSTGTYQLDDVRTIP